MNRKLQVTKDLLTLIKKDHLQPGQSLPSERILAENFRASRNTVREAIKVLENKGIVEVRAGSGCYLKAKPDRIPEKNNTTTSVASSNLMDQLEACYLIFPGIAFWAVAEISGKIVQDLEDTIVRLSKAIIKGDFEDFIKSDGKFREIIVSSLGNHILSQMNARPGCGFSNLGSYFPNFPEDEIRHLFAGYVKALGAIRNRNQEETKRILEYNLLFLVHLLTKYSSLVFSHRMQTLLKDFIIDPSLV